MAQVGQYNDENTGVSIDNGIQDYKELQDANANRIVDDIESNERFLTFDDIPSAEEIAAMYPRIDPMRDIPQKVANPLAGKSKTLFGDSMWDPDVFGAYEYENAQDVRANNQPAIAKYAAGITKGGVLAAGTFINGTLGTAAGIIDALATGDASKLWDNPVSNAIKSVEEWSEEALPNYYTEAEENTPFALGTANFWADKVIKNLGFTIGAVYSGGAMSSLFRGLSRGVQAARGIKAVTGQPSVVAAYAGSVTSAIGEASVEALNAKDDFIERYKAENEMKTAATLEDAARWFETQAGTGTLAQLKDLEDWRNSQPASSLMPDPNNPEGQGLINNVDLEYQRRLNTILNTPEKRNAWEQYKAERNKIMNAYNDTNRLIEENGIHVGNTDFVLNTILLTLTNQAMYGKIFAGGKRTAREAKRIRGNDKEGYSVKGGKASAAGAYTADALLEGTEEMAQSIGAEIPMNYYGTGVDNFFLSSIDPDAELETQSWIKSVGEGITTKIGDPAAWEEFAIGAFTGALGVPMFGKKIKRNGKEGYGFTWRGGLPERVGDYRAETRSAERIVSYMNGRVNDPKFKAYYQGAIRHQKYQNDMDAAVESNDEFDYKNAEHAQLVSDVIMFDKAGKLEDLRGMIGDALDESDENLAAIVESTVGKTADGKLTGLYSKYAQVDENGNVKAAFGSEASRDEMRQDLRKRKREVDDAIEQVQVSRDEVMKAAKVQLSDAQLEELTYLNAAIKDRKKRAEELQGGALAWLNEIRSSADDSAVKELATKLVDAEGVDERVEITRTANKETVRKLNEAIDNSDWISSVDKEAAKDSLRLWDAIGKYQKVYNDYMANPGKITASHEEARAKTAERKVNEEATVLENKLINTTGTLGFQKVFDESDADEALKSYVLDKMARGGNKSAQVLQKKKAIRRKLRAAARDVEVDDSDPNLRSDVMALIEALYDKAEQADEMTDENSSVLDDLSLIQAGTTEERHRRLEAAKYALKTMIDTVRENDAEADTVSGGKGGKRGKGGKGKTQGGTQGTQGSTQEGTQGGGYRELRNKIKAFFDKDPNQGDFNSGVKVVRKGTKDDDVKSLINKLAAATDSKKDVDEYKIIDILQTAGQDTLRKFYAAVDSNGKLLDGQRAAINAIKTIMGHDNLGGTQGGTQGTQEGKNDKAAEEMKKAAKDFVSKHPKLKDEAKQVSEDLENTAGNTALKAFVKRIMESTDDLTQAVIDFLEKSGENFSTLFNDFEEALGRKKPTLKIVTVSTETIIGENDQQNEDNAGTGKEDISKRYEPALSQCNMGNLKRHDYRDKDYVIEEEQHNSSFHKIYDYFRSKGVFDFLNNGKLHVGDEVLFMIDPDGFDETTIFMCVRNADGSVQVIGSINQESSKQINRYDNLKTLSEKVHAEYAESRKNGGTGMFVASPTVHVRELTAGWVQVGDENEVQTIDKAMRQGERPVLAVVRSGRLDTNGAVEDGKIVPIKKMGSDHQGRIYLLVPNGSGKYTPMAARSKTVDASAFNVSNPQTATEKAVAKILEKIANATSQEGLDEAVKELKEYIFLDDTAFEFEKLADGSARVKVTRGSGTDATTSITSKASEVLRALDGLRYQVDASKINRGDYNGRVAEVIESNVRTTELKNVSFHTTIVDENCVERKEGQGGGFTNGAVSEVAGKAGNYELRKDGKVYLNGKEVTDKATVQNVRNEIEIASRAAPSVEEANKTVERINKNQEKVDRSQTTGDHYMIMEDDGKYHEYQRVTTVIGTYYNAPDTEDARKRSQRATKAGTLVDKVVREFFQLKPGEELTKPSEGMSDKAFNSLKDALENIKAEIDKRGERFLTNNLVVFAKTADGRRIAGEIDILAVDKQGNFKIYDIKTSQSKSDSKYGGYDSKGKNSIRTKREQYTLQLSAYKNLFESQYGQHVNKLAIMPFKININPKTDNVTVLTKENGIPLTYNPAVNVPLTIERGDEQSIKPDINTKKENKPLLRERPVGDEGASRRQGEPSPVTEAIRRGDVEGAVKATADKLGVKVKVARSVDEITDEKTRQAIESGRNIKGYFDPTTGEIVVYEPNATNAEDAVMTTLHEAVGHYGLRQLFGKDFKNAMSEIFINASHEVRGRIAAAMRENGWDLVTAVEEYLSELAERNGFTRPERSIFNRFKNWLRDALRKIGINLGNRLTDDDLRYIMWRSYQNLASNRGGQAAMEADEAFKRRLEKEKWEAGGEDSVRDAIENNDVEGAVKATADKLGVKVKVLHDVDEITDDETRQAIKSGSDIKSWYETGTSEIVLYKPDNARKAVITTLKAVASLRGLRGLLGKEFMGNSLNPFVKAAEYSIYSLTGRKALGSVEEYLAMIADAPSKKWWEEDALKSFSNLLREELSRRGIDLDDLSYDELHEILKAARTQDPRLQAAQMRNAINRGDMEGMINAIADRLGIAVRATNDANELPEGKNIKSWYDNGEIVVYLPGVKDAREAAVTALREAVRRDGLRGLLGDNEIETLVSDLGASVTEEVNKFTGEGERPVGVNKYLVSLVNKGELTDSEKNTFSLLKRSFGTMLSEKGIWLDEQLSDEEFRSIVSADRSTDVKDENSPVSEAIARYNKAKTEDEKLNVKADAAKAVADGLGVKVIVAKELKDMPLEFQKDFLEEWEKGNKPLGAHWNGEIVIYLPDNNDAYKAASVTLDAYKAALVTLHEVVGHHGLKKLFGDDFNKAMLNIYKNASDKVKRDIDKWGWEYRFYKDEFIKKYGWEKAWIMATDEYMARLADKIWLTPDERSTFDRFKDWLIDKLRESGITFRRKMTEADVRYIIRRSYQNLMDSKSQRDEEAGIAVKARVDGTYLTAPNGSPTNLSPRMWLKTRTEGFRRDFGDWMGSVSDWKRKSLYGDSLDANGEPALRDGRFTSPFGTVDAVEKGAAFDTLAEGTRDMLGKQGWSEELWDGLTREEQEQAMKCVAF